LRSAAKFSKPSRALPLLPSRPLQKEKDGEEGVAAAATGGEGEAEKSRLRLRLNTPRKTMRRNADCHPQYFINQRSQLLRA